MSGVEVAPDLGAAATRLVPERALVRLRRLAERRPRAVLTGEFSAGKSSLVNLLLRRDLAPTQVTATHVPPCWYRHDAADGDGSAVAIDRDGTRRSIALSGLAGESMERCARVEIVTTAALPGDVEIGDVPGAADPMLAHDDLRDAACRAEIALWCTPAPQAWRQSEKAAWLSLPRRLRRRAILVVTQADRLSPGDLDLVLGRLRREADGLFAHVVAIATPEARAARTRASWTASGAAALVAAIETEAMGVRRARASMMARYAPRATRALAEAPASAVARSEPTPSRQAGWNDRMGPPARSHAPGPGPIRPRPMTAGCGVARDGDRRRSIREGTTMKDQVTDISALSDIKGFVGACLVDSESGLMLGSLGGGALDLEVAGAGNTEVVRAKLEVMRQLDLDEAIEDILITLGSQYHLIRPLERNPQVFLYLALDKKQANLGMARMGLKKVEQQIRL